MILLVLSFGYSFNLDCQRSEKNVIVFVVILTDISNKWNLSLGSKAWWLAHVPHSSEVQALKAGSGLPVLAYVFSGVKGCLYKSCM